MTERQKLSFETVGRNITYLRKICGLSKKEMAKILHIGTDSLNKIEKGIMPKRLSVDILFYIQEYFGISPSDMFCKTGVITFIKQK